MSDYKNLVEALRRCDMRQGCFNANCRYSVGKYFCDMDKVHKDAAAAIEALQANTKRMEDELSFSESSADEFQMQAALQNALLAKQVPHWVSVEERLPEPGEYVLAWECQGFCVVDRYIDINDGRWGLSNDGAIYTHWMPLPSAPELPQEVQE